MRRQGAALTSAERRAVSEYVTGRPPGSYRDPFRGHSRERLLHGAGRR